MRASPRLALLSWAGDSIGQGDSGGGQHEREAHEISKCGEGKTLVTGQRHYRKGQSDTDRCDKPTVLAEQTHPVSILWQGVWIPFVEVPVEVTFVIYTFVLERSRVSQWIFRLRRRAFNRRVRGEMPQSSRRNSN